MTAHVFSCCSVYEMMPLGFSLPAHPSPLSVPSVNRAIFSPPYVCFFRPDDTFKGMETDYNNNRVIAIG